MPPPPRNGPSKARIAFQLRSMAASAVSSDFAAGLNAAADMLDGTKHVCVPPNWGHYFHCEPCNTKWYGFHRPTANGTTRVEWVTSKDKEVTA